MKTMQTLAPTASGDHRPWVWAGYLTIILIFVVLGGWAAFAKLDSAVIASGTVAVESNRKLVQHYEGGIVSELLVKETQMVKAGDVLLRLQKTQASANLETIVGQLDGAQALEARLLAEKQGLERVVFPTRLKERLQNPMTVKVLQDQENQMKDRRASLDGQRQILESRIEQLTREIEGQEAVARTTAAQIESLETEMAKVGKLASRGLFPLNRMHAMERDLLQQQGRIGEIRATISKNEKAIGETRLQILQIEQKFQEEVIQQIRDVRMEIAELEERMRVAADVMQRVEIRAPQTGMVQNIQVHTVGGVIRNGETLMEIVPANDILLVHAQVATIDINHVGIDQTAEVRFPGFKSRNSPLIIGRVKSVTADSLFDETTRQHYYLAIVEVREADIPEQYKGKLTPGMPAEVLVSTGERTVADYLVSPLLDSIRHSMREL
jgi:HlyD family secretion protein